MLKKKLEPFFRRTFFGILLISADYLIRRCQNLGPRFQHERQIQIQFRKKREWTMECVDTGLSGHWIEWTMDQVDTGSSGHWIEWTMDRVDTGSSGQWIEWTMDRVDNGSSGHWIEWTMDRVDNGSSGQRIVCRKKARVDNGSCAAKQSAVRQGK
jgi:hypothetical protein